MILTTTPTIEGKSVSSYLGVTSAEVILGNNVVRDFLASVTDVIGGRSGVYENKLSKGKEIVLKELEENARKLGADAIIGIDLDFETLREGMMIIVATGTAVKLA